MRRMLLLALVLVLCAACSEDRRGGGSGGGESGDADGGEPDGGAPVPLCGQTEDADGLVVDGYVVDVLWSLCPTPVEERGRLVCAMDDGTRRICGFPRFTDCQEWAASHGERCVPHP